MQEKISPPQTVDGYMKSFSPPVRNMLEKLRLTIKEAAPQAEELISYQMPAYKYHGMLVYFAAWKTHIGFYPAGKLDTFQKELSAFGMSKGTIRFPIDKPLPWRLISKIVKYRVKQQEEKRMVKMKSVLPPKKEGSMLR